MLETGADSLRFTLEETVRFFKTVRTPRLTVEDVAALHERTEGWAVGLRMAALSLQEDSDVPRFIAAFTGSQRYVMDYLTEEVLQKQPPQILISCRRLRCWTDSNGPSLRRRHRERRQSEHPPRPRASSPVHRAAGREARQWYRYEHLFADLLRHQALREYRQGGISELHRRASRWQEESQLPDEAIAHATAAEDWDRAADIIESIGQERTDHGEWATIRDWLRVLPDSVLQTRSRLCVWCSMAFRPVTGPSEDAEARINRVATIVHRDAHDEGEMAASLAFFYQVRGDTVRTAEFAQKALSLLAPDQVQARSRASYVLGLSYSWRGLFTEAKPLLIEAQQSAERAGNLGVAATSLHLLSEIDRYSGRLRKAAEQVKRAIELAGTTPRRLPHTRHWAPSSVNGISSRQQSITWRRQLSWASSVRHRSSWHGR